MTKKDLISQFQAADSAGTLLTPKHNPGNMSTSYRRFRTVLSHDLANNLNVFISSGKFSLKEHVNNRFPNSPLYIEIIPDSDSGFDVPSSGITANSIFASSTLDRIIAVSGSTSGWHLFGEDSSNLQTKLINGDLSFVKNIL